MPSTSRDIIVVNKLGLHARPAMQFVDTANRFQAKVRVQRSPPDSRQADGKSVMEMITLEATEGTRLRISADGPDAPDAVQTLAQLFADKFGEE
jgi:phosphocarrier protein HPr